MKSIKRNDEFKKKTTRLFINLFDRFIKYWVFDELLYVCVGRFFKNSGTQRFANGKSLESGQVCTCLDLHT